MGAVGTQAHLIFPRRVLPGRSWTPPQDDGVGPSNAEGCTELTSLLEKWRRASDDGLQASMFQTRNDEHVCQELANSTAQQDRRSGAEAPVAAVASLIQHFEGRALHPEMLPQQEHVAQPSDVVKPHTPPKRETPLVPLQRKGVTEEEGAAERSPASPVEHISRGTEDLNSVLMSSILESKGGPDLQGQPPSWKDPGHDAELAGRLPAYWPAARSVSSTEDTPAGSHSPALDSPSGDCRRGELEGDSPGAEGLGAGENPASAGRQHLKTYAQLLSEETAAMKNAVGPWQPRIEKSSKLMEFQDTTERLRHVYKRLQPPRTGARPDKAGTRQEALSLVADASAASHTDPVSAAAALCFNGGQVVGKTPEWVMDLQQPPLTLSVSPAARPSQDSASAERAEHDYDSAEVAARRLMARAAVEALAEASQRAAAPGATGSLASRLPGQQAAAASPQAMLRSAGYLAWAGLEDSIDLSARLCGAALQSIPLVGARLAAGEPDLAAQGPSLPVRLLRQGIKLVYGTAGNVVGMGEGIVYLAKQL